MVFRINRSNEAVLQPEAIKLVPGLKKLNKNQVLYIILVYDYDSPLAFYPLESRMAKAEEIVGKKINQENKNLLAGIDAYKGLQFDPMREAVESYREKILSLSNKLADEDNPTRISGILSSIEKLQNAIDNYEKEISKQIEDEVTIKGGGNLSQIEKFAKNLKDYDSSPKPRSHAIDIETSPSKAEELLP